VPKRAPRSTYRICLAAVIAGAIFAPITADAQEAEPCTLYTQDFPSFTTIEGMDNGAFRVEWCQNGSSITSSSFCNTGNGLRMNASSQDPILWLYHEGQECAQILLEFQYAQFADSQTTLLYSISNDTTLDCAAPMTQTAGLLTNTSGLCTTALHPITLPPGSSIYWKFDHGPNANAIILDSIKVHLEGCPCEGQVDQRTDCCDIGIVPGCLDPVIEACICEIDPYCCENVWDEVCVEMVQSLSCGSCGSGDCLTSFYVDFGTFFSPGTVCEKFPDVFESCEGSGPYTTSSGECVNSADLGMRFGTGFPISAATTKCVDLSGATAAALRFDYTKTALSLGPEVEISIDDGASFVPLWEAPFADGNICESICLDLAEFLGTTGLHFRFSSGSSIENGSRFDDIELIAETTCIVLDRDCNENEIPDATDIATGDAQDCNGNGIPDECDIANLYSPDLNNDAVPDECNHVSAYALDFGEPEDSIGLTGGGEILFLNSFLTVEGAETISSVSWSWGDAVPSTNRATVVLYADPTDDGDPIDATLLVHHPVDTYAQPYGFQRAAIPPTNVGPPGSVFYVGIVCEHEDTENPAGFDSVSAFPGRSWAVGDPAAINVFDLADNDLPPLLVEQAGLLGNWTIRADVEACAALYTIDALYIVAESPIDMNSDGLSDDWDNLILQRCIRSSEAADMLAD
jgi:hypothetical protein